MKCKWGSCDAEVLIMKIQLCITGINYFLKCIKNRKHLFAIVIIFHNITVLLYFVAISDFQKHLKILPTPTFWTKLFKVYIQVHLKYVHTIVSHFNQCNKGILMNIAIINVCKINVFLSLCNCSPYIIGTMSQATSSAPNLQLHHNFRYKTALCFVFN